MTGSRITCSVAFVSPWCRKFLRRSSTGSMSERCGDFVHVPLHGEDGLRRAEAAKCAVGNVCSSPTTARARAHWGKDTGRWSAAWRAKAPWKKALRTRRRRCRDRSPSPAACHRCRARCDAARARDGAWWLRPDPPCGRRPSSPDGRSSWPAAPRGRRAWKDNPLCRRTRRRSQSGPRAPFLQADRRRRAAI